MSIQQILDAHSIVYTEISQPQPVTAVSRIAASDH